MAPFKVIIGEEIKTSVGEIIGYFLQEEIPGGLTAQENIRLIKEQGGLVCVLHPFDRFRKSAMFFAKKYGNAVLVGSDCHSPYEVDIKQGTLRCQRSAMVAHIITKWNKVACKFGL